MRRHLTPKPRRNRPGITIVDVAVVLAIVATAIALIFPATRSARITSRRVQCLNNIKNLNVAVIDYQSIDADKFPFLVTGDEGRGDSWCIQLLPVLDSAALARLLRDDRRQVIQSDGTPNLSLRFFTCPDDSNNFRADGGLSYAANAGYLTDDVWGRPEADQRTQLMTLHAAGTIHFGGDTFEERVRRQFGTGLFWRECSAVEDVRSADTNRARAPRMTGRFVQEGDGLRYTLLFAENCQSRNWASTNVNDVGFGLFVTTNPGTAAPDPAVPTGRIGRSGPLSLDAGWGLADERRSAMVNSNPKSAPGQAPRPSSQHSGGWINVGYADGHAATLDEGIDPTVYARLLTPRGESHGQLVVRPEQID